MNNEININMDIGDFDNERETKKLIWELGYKTG
jgi:hypothetical protein